MKWTRREVKGAGTIAAAIWFAEGDVSQARLAEVLEAQGYQDAIALARYVDMGAIEREDYKRDGEN